MIRRSPLPRSTKPIRRRNPKRQRSEFARCYHSRERVRFVKSLGCVVCTMLSPFFGLATAGKCHNAHTETGGMGRKADYTTIVPLCPVHHKRYDEHLDPCDSEKARQLIKAAAAQVEKLWLATPLTAIGISVYPVVGELAPFAVSTGTQFCSFNTSTIHGLARVDDRRIDLLAVVAVVSGRGDFRKFLDELRANYDTICFWEIWNQDLNAMLLRRGFTVVREPVDGDLVQGLRWDRS